MYGMKTIIASVAALILLVADARGEPVWSTRGGHRYAMTPEPGTWLDAQQWAKNAGGNLVTINSQDENDWIVATLASNLAVWIGFYQPTGSPEPAGNWQWISGEPVVFTNWWAGQPNELLPGDNYALLNSDAQDGVWFSGEWHDVPLGGWPGPHYGIVEIIPEPGAFALLALGALAIARSEPRKRRLLLL